MSQKCAVDEHVVFPSHEFSNKFSERGMFDELQVFGLGMSFYKSFDFVLLRG